MFDKLEESKDDTKANITGKLGIYLIKPTIESMSKDLEYESFDDKHVKQENKSKNNYTYFNANHLLERNTTIKIMKLIMKLERFRKILMRKIIVMLRVIYKAKILIVFELAIHQYMVNKNFICI